MFEGKVEGAKCCEGLSPIRSFSDYINEQCIYTPVSLVTCASCGDGICGLGEHYCTCPEDCKKP